MAIERLFINEGVKEVGVRNYLAKELKRAGLAGIVIQRTPLVTRIVLYCDRPALVIGRKGKNVKTITKVIEDEYKIEKPELEIKKVEKPNLEPNIVAYRIASALERGMNPRKVGYKALQAIMKDGAKGAEIKLSGKLVGKGGRARVLKMKSGYMKKCGHPSFEQVLHGDTVAMCKAGIIGVDVSIVPQNIHFPDEINIIKPQDMEVEVLETAEEAASPEGAAERPEDDRAKTTEAKAGEPKAENGAHKTGDADGQKKKASGKQKRRGKSAKTEPADIENLDEGSKKNEARGSKAVKEKGEDEDINLTKKNNGHHAI